MRILFFLLLPAVCFSQELDTFYYDNGNISSICKFVNGKGEGEWKQYYNNGQLWYIGEYVNGKEEGEYKE